MAPLSDLRAPTDRRPQRQCQSEAVLRTSLGDRRVSALWLSARMLPMFSKIRTGGFARLAFLGLVGLFLSTITMAMPPAQVAKVPSADEIRQQVRDFAGRHVREDSPRSTSDVIAAFNGNAAQVPGSEIALIYEEEYKRQKDAQKKTLWERVLDQGIPKEGLPVVVILFVIAWVRTWLLEKVKQTGEAISNWFYQRLAGTRLFRSLALGRYRKGLIDQYQRLKMPFRADRSLLMRDVYVPLMGLEGDERGRIDTHEALKRSRRILITGEPGAGKSMLCKYLALAYAEGRLAGLSQDPVPILLELHRLNDPNTTIEKELVAEMARMGFPKADNFIAAAIESGSLLLLLDGLDEVNGGERQKGDETRRDKVVRLLRDLLRSANPCRVVITCRSAVYNGELNADVDERLQLAEFSDNQVQRFLRSWVPFMRPQKSVEQLLRTLRDRPRIMALARNPLLLSIVAYLYTDTEHVLPHSRAEFYELSTEFLLSEWKQENNRYRMNARDKRSVLEHLALWNHDGASHNDSDLRSMDYRMVLEEMKKLLPGLNLRPEDAQPLLDEIVQRSGLLLSIDGGERYQFVHITLQEFFAARQLRERSKELIERFSSNPGRWREVVMLSCGLSTDSTDLIREVYAQNPLTGFECLSDARKVDEQLVSEILDHFKARLGLPEPERDAIAQTFGTVAADRQRPRGQEVFNFLRHELQGSHAARVLAAATALSYTNLPDAADLLSISLAGEQPQELLPLLLRMGDLAVPALVPLAAIGNPKAIDGLEAIGTPLAAEALVSLLGDNVPVPVAREAAWRLGILLSSPAVEAALRDFNPPHKLPEAERYSWVFRPFDESDASPLRKITGRVAYLIATDERTDRIRMPPLDPRLAIPLSIEWLKTDAKADRAEARLARAHLPSALQRSDLLLPHVLGPKWMTELDPSPRLRQQLEQIPERTRYQYLARFSQRIPDREDWLGIRKPQVLVPEKTWQSVGLRFLVLLVSAFTFLQLVNQLRHAPQFVSWSNTLCVGAMVGMLIAIAATWQGYRTIEPGRYHFIELGVFLLALLLGPLLPFIIFYVKFIKKVPLEKHRLVIIVGAHLICYSWIPAVGYFVTISLLHSLTTPQVVAGWAVLILASVALWRSGWRRERKATNPLFGLLDDLPSSAGQPQR